MVKTLLNFTMLMVSVAGAVRGGEESGRWWPTQALPKAIVRTVPWQQFGALGEAYRMMVCSTAGLAAKAVNEGHGDELVWVASNSPTTDEWLRYSIWEHLNKRPRSGTPAKIAREICDTVSATPSAELPRYDWVITHVWSYFRKAPGTDENAEDLPRVSKLDKKSARKEQAKEGVRGYTPVVWCAERLPENIRVVSPEELVWRIRMKHDAAQTLKLIQQLGKETE